MRKKIAALIISVLTIVGLGAAPALAWDYGLTASAQCQSDGSYKITWAIDNSTNNETLTVQSSSNTAVLPTNTQVAANQTASYVETESGVNAPATYSLTLGVNWPSDTASHSKTASAALTTACTQPTHHHKHHHHGTTTTTGGKGGGTPQIKVSSTPQVSVTPSSPVNAGDGSATYTNPLAIGGLVGSVAAIGAGLGLRRFKAGSSL